MVVVDQYTHEVRSLYGRNELDPAAGISQGSVRIGNEFTITVELSDLGEAGFTGSYEVEMLIPPEGYTTSDTLIKSDADDSLTWTILAPAKPTEGQADTLQRRIEIVRSNVGDES